MSTNAAIGETSAGEKKGRASETERIPCILIRTGAIDIAVAAKVYGRRIKRVLGPDFLSYSFFINALSRKRIGKEIMNSLNV